MVAFVPSDLGINDDALAQITAQLANAINADPITDAINRCLQTVTDYTLRYQVPDERVKRLTRALVLFDIYSNPALGVMPPNVATQYNNAMKELVDIRDGKFHDLQLANPSDPSLAGPETWGQFGGAKHVDFRRGGGEH